MEDSLRVIGVFGGTVALVYILLIGGDKAMIAKSIYTKTFFFLASSYAMFLHPTSSIVFICFAIGVKFVGFLMHNINDAAKICFVSDRQSKRNDRTGE